MTDSFQAASENEPRAATSAPTGRRYLPAAGVGLLLAIVIVAVMLSQRGFGPFAGGQVAVAGEDKASETGKSRKESKSDSSTDSSTDPTNSKAASGARKSDASAKESKKDGKADDKTVDYPFQNRIPVPENIFDGGKGWLNASGDIRLKDLKGKIVVLDFWTYCCINCMHVLPDLAFIEKKFPNEVVVIGVHSAKFDNEKETENIRRAVQRYNIEHPVVNDAEMLIWRKFGINAWPTLLVIDAEGNACFATSGEGKKEILDLVVTKLVEYHTATKTLDKTPIRFDLERAKMPPKPLKFPGKVLADAAGGRLFIADTNHNRIVVAGLDGKLQAVIGSGAIGAKDGDFASATFDHPQGMALAGDTLYVADTENHLLRTVDLKAKTVGTLAGTGEQDRERNSGGKLRETPLNSPWDLLVHDGSLYIAMAGPHQLFRHKLGSDVFELYAGSGREDVRNGSLGEAAFAQPSGFATDGKFLYVVDSEGSSIRRVPFQPDGEVTTVAGTHNLPRGQSLFAFGDVDGVGDEARFQHPIGLAYHDGALYVADSYNHKIKKVTLKEKEDAGDSKTWLGDAKSGDGLDPLRLNEPHGIAIANGKAYIADTNNHRIVVADLKSGAAAAFVIDGLSPPKSTEAAPAEAPTASVTKLPAQTVKTAELLTFEVAVTLPEGYKFNTQGAVTGRLKSEGEQAIVAVDQLDQRHKAEVEDGTIRFSVPATGKPGKAEFDVAVSLTYCREGTGGVCKLATLRWTVPVEAAADGKAKAIALSGAIEAR